MTETKIVALIACSKRKAVHPPRALPVRDLYTGQLFKAQLAYARHALALPDEQILVLSARYGLVRLDEVRESYDQVLSRLSRSARQQWGWEVAGHLRELHPRVSTAYILTGATYREPLARPLALAAITAIVPHPTGLGYGRQLKWYREALLG